MSLKFNDHHRQRQGRWPIIHQSLQILHISFTPPEHRFRQTNSILGVQTKNLLIQLDKVMADHGPTTIPRLGQE